MTTTKLSRRSILKGAAAAAGLAFVPGCAMWSGGAYTTAPKGPNETVRLAVAGMRGKGWDLARQVHQEPNTRIVAFVEPDLEILQRRINDMEELAGYRPEGFQDVRYVLDRDDIDGLVIATPNHWHALMTIWACQAGKDVYVEKPGTHNIWEGRKLHEAAVKYNRVVQHGTQSRSDIGNHEAFEYIREGHIGKILYAHGLCFRDRHGIGDRLASPLRIPAHIDYNLWAGPAPMEPIHRPSLHYDWHWVWQTGNGDIGNQGPHEWDLCRWALGYDTLPRRAVSTGGRFIWNDAGETPNVQLAIVEWDEGDAPLIFEVQNVRRARDAEAMNAHRGVRVGLIVQCEGGYFAGKDGGWIHDNDGRRIHQVQGGGSGDHIKNFVEVMRHRDQSKLAAPIKESWLSDTPFHMANTSQRLGADATPEEAEAIMSTHEAAGETLHRLLELLAAHDVDLRREPLQLGPWLEFDPRRERYTGALADKANAHLKRDYRAPFTIPDRV